MPVRSAGCFQCRKRKIRCDEKRPGCDRCKTHGVSCPGYRLPAPGQIAFADETRAVVSRATKGRKGSDGITTIKFLENNEEHTSTTSTRNSVPPEGTKIACNRCNFHDYQDDLLVDAVDSMKSRYPHGTEWIFQDDLSSTDGTISPFSSSSGTNTPPADFKLGLVRKETSMDLAKAMALYATPQFMPSAAAEKAMIYSTFVDAYLPKHRPETDAHFSFLEHLITTPDLRPEVGEALDALSLVQVGSIYHDDKLLKQSVRSYAKALQGLVKTLSHSNTSSFVADDYVLATVTLLATCEFFDEISQMGEGWSKHIQGSQQLLAARGAKSIQSRMSLMLYSNMRHGALSHALIARKCSFLGKPEWRALAWRDEIRDGSTGFYEYALQVPDLLESWDEFAKGDKLDVTRLDEFLFEARTLEQGLRLWFHGFQSKARSSGTELHILVGVEQFPTFCSLVSDRTVDKCFLFPSFMIAYLVSVYWDVMHFLRTTIKKIHHARHEADSAWFPSQEETVTEDELMGYVMDLMRCFPFFCEPTNSSTGQIGIFLPLRTAAFYCTEHGHWSLLKWVGAVRDNVFTRGMRPPSVRERRPPGTARIAVMPTPRSPILKDDNVIDISAGGTPITWSSMVER
ncbi:Putative zn(2)-C6 fungal-type DNA-binding domain-containing protein [Septoria linicola]|uniref:Zn(2)-C6 fungal-type DNA-binding domain-containing protein n=1 Tax=Septoria linicola TaxID=215465 RepID=A0A9Q9AZ82_9PEZI|nr:Putative zn(2)-C6 fungal-type DNA-binding domain-containing protein [Septoria linicola]